jgi:DNA modification methylase
MSVYFADEQVTVYHGDCLDVLAGMPDASVDAVVTDPPYELAFMGKSWDASGVAFQPATWELCLRVLKPGGHLLAFGGSRTWHRLACAIEDAGFELRDSIAWLYGSGFPKSLDVSKAIDRARNDDVTHVAEFLTKARSGRPLGEAVKALGFVGTDGTHGVAAFFSGDRSKARVPSIDQWEKLKALYSFGDEMDAEINRLNTRKGTPGDAWELRPAPENSGRVGMAKSWDDGKNQKWNGNMARGGEAVLDAAKQWQGWGTALKPAFEPVVVARKPLVGTVAANVQAYGVGALNIDACRVATDEVITNHSRGPESAVSKGIYGDSRGQESHQTAGQSLGRWPTNVALDDSQAAELDKQSGNVNGQVGMKKTAGKHRFIEGDTETVQKFDYGVTDSDGGASRFFPTFKYTPKAPGTERPTADGITHPTVKPLDLMRWLIRLVTPPGGVVLDPFAGSGTTGEAAIHEHKWTILIEREDDYLPLIKARLHKPMEVGFEFEEPA